MSQFPVFETIAILDGIPQNLAFHQARMDNAIEELFKQTSVFNLAEIIQVPERYQNGLVRCRIDYNQQDYHIIFSIYQKNFFFPKRKMKYLMIHNILLIIFLPHHF